MEPSALERRYRLEQRELQRRKICDALCYTVGFLLVFALIQCSFGQTLYGVEILTTIFPIVLIAVILLVFKFAYLIYSRKLVGPLDN
ncbi:MAG: hypothetical protein RTU92_02525 [Candidatus Thorarchaeota archaeon]